FWDNPVKANAAADWFNQLQVPKRAILGSWEHIWALRADEQLRLLAWMDHWLKGRDTGIMDTPVVEVLTNTRLHRADTEWPTSRATPVEVPLPGGSYLAPVASLAVSSEPYPDGLYVTGVPTLAFRASLPAGGNAYFHAELFEETPGGERTLVIMGWLNAALKDGHTTYAPLAPGEARDLEMRLLPIDHVVQPGNKLTLVLRSVRADDAYGTPEGAVVAQPGLVQVAGGALRLPTLPMDELSPAPRSAS
ncbi:MAG TPA: CocE/NonD family hydrolase C-terminal non-catalytic domain-containing protein, partial [Candidatus Thermoplasmatota archaeon]|nr:CocE/NonD family hydrolase C-terminal non-catalytic domain-containing protein [Candidatus Thermoplasmatota archaeon]